MLEFQFIRTVFKMFKKRIQISHIYNKNHNLIILITEVWIVGPMTIDSGVYLTYNIYCGMKCNLPIVTYFVQRQHHNVQVVEHNPFFNIFPEYLTDGIVHAL